MSDSSHIEGVAFTDIAAQFGTPCYIYSKQTIIENWQAYNNAFQHSGKAFKINYAVKANSNLAVLKILAQLGSGFDVVSGGEIKRVLAADGKPENIIFSGVGKSRDEISLALDLGIALHVESEAELQRIQEIAVPKNKIANIGIRVNPNITGDSHPYNTTGGKDNKFGIDATMALSVFRAAADLSHIKVKGIACHIGSQITTMDPFLDVITQFLELIAELQNYNIKLQYIDLGGGLGICYKDEKPPTPQEYVAAITAKLQDNDLEIHIEPGRSIAASAGTLLTRVEYLKTTADNHFAIVDAAMNDLMRPALYASYHAIAPVMPKAQSDLQVTEQSYAPEKIYKIVGPICESGDFLAMQRRLRINAGDLLIVKDCGAYGFSMSSNYNTRPRCAEVLVAGNKAYLIRKRETIEQLLENEMLVNA